MWEMHVGREDLLKKYDFVWSNWLNWWKKWAKMSWVGRRLGCMWRSGVVLGV
jgi:hypothetical protein